ncbi:hypothetical protein M758_1G098400 [Ceratodon purpureus]|uniref:Uncharacterized protein n=1 Tax=Ceratodon purpureus TaxID=3225 RepID=A0A8T0J4T2_CERPU|nr:hypothetical protein KC19_1G109000 [Ceratodon purpureus]KAG0629373.1 hypothetical protein M758_1G098400 [Ceratodon purpureus]
MPDYGRPSDIEQRLERTLDIYPPLDYGSTLLDRGLQPHPPSGGRKLNGGIMMRPGYKGPTVNIRPPKWTDNNFWIRADNYPDAQYIADAVYYHIGRGPFHFLDANFQYPPLRLATCELLTREACQFYVESIAKGPAHLKQRKDYGEKVKELVLKAVKSPEAVLFLNSLRPAAPSATSVEATEECETPDDGNEGVSIEEDSDFAGVPAEEVVGNNVGDELAEQSPTPMEADNLSEWAIQTLVPYPTDVVSEPVASSGEPPYIPTFCLDFRWFDDSPSFEAECILGSDRQSLDAAWSQSAKKAEENTLFGDFKDLFSGLDTGEKAILMTTDEGAWKPFLPQTNY